MKKIIALLFVSLFISSVQAETVFVFPRCSYSASNGECTIHNNSGKDITCTIRATARTRKGSFLNTYDYRVLYQGMFAWVRVYANNPTVDPIISLQAHANCNTLN